MLRKLLLLPFFAFGLLAIINFVGGSVFGFFAWLFLGIMYIISTYPFITEMDEKMVPVFQIFASLLFVFLFAWSIATLDFHNAGLPIIQSVLYGLSIGLLLVAVIMILKGKK